jgi:hypothetical protein
LFILLLPSESISKVNYTEDWEIYGYSNSNASCTIRSEADLASDPKWKIAKDFSILAVVCGVSESLLVSGYQFEMFLWFSVGMFALATISQGITFLFFQSNGCSNLPGSVDYKNTSMITASPSERCTLGYGAKLGIAAIVLWLLCCLIGLYLVHKNCEKTKNHDKNLRNICIQSTPL